MSDNLDAQPDEFRSIASYRDAAAADNRKARIPHAYLDEYITRNGTIQAPVHAYLVEGHTSLHHQNLGMAADHERGRDHLLGGASGLEEADVLQTSAILDETSRQRNA
ncbi:hypothetical protein ACIRRA_43175 [Nocardia sp. NPDC101769]|uniref:hypothetical protein n=1 Tax=Nocardia sp. NPDC101769 TaxID=3364333 RepID=UPI00380E2BFC